MAELRAQLKSAGGDVSGRHTRTPWSLPVFATFVTFAFVAVTLAPPSQPAAAFATVAPGSSTITASQSLSVGGQYENGNYQGAAERDAFTITEPVAAPVITVSAAPAAGVPDPGSAQAIAYGILQAQGMGDDQYNCLVALWNRESGWNIYAFNSSSGAYGIPQALPGEKMASSGADWATSAATQINWGLGYIGSRYGTPCGAWEHSETSGWY